MKKKLTSVITMCMAASLIFTSSGAIAFASEVEAEESVDEENTDEGNAEVESEEIEWTVEQMAALSDILTGIEDKEYTAGTAGKYDVHMGVDFDKDIVAGVLFNTADLDSATPGEYDVTYFVYFNREPLLDYMDENDINADDFSGLEDNSEDCIEITVKGKVAVNAANEESVAEEPTYEESVVEEDIYEEPVYEEPVYEEPVYEEPVYEEPVYEEPVYEEDTSENTESVYEVSREKCDDCDGSGHGYWDITYSDGSHEYIDY